MTKFVAELFQRDVKNIRDEIYDKYIGTKMDIQNLVKAKNDMYCLLKDKIQYYIKQRLFLNGTDTFGLCVGMSFIGTNSINMGINFPEWLVKEYDDALYS